MVVPIIAVKSSLKGRGLAANWRRKIVGELINQKVPTGATEIIVILWLFGGFNSIFGNKLVVVALLNFNTVNSPPITSFVVVLTTAGTNVALVIFTNIPESPILVIAGLVFGSFSRISSKSNKLVLSPKIIQEFSLLYSNVYFSSSKFNDNIGP